MWVLKIVTDGQTDSLTNLIKCVVVLLINLDSVVNMFHCLLTVFESSFILSTLCEQIGLHLAISLGFTVKVHICYLEFC